jgi:hypothetical protein
MLAEMAQRADVALARGTDVAHEAVYATVLHLRRIVGAVSVALVRVKREAEDLVWDYEDLAGDLRSSAGSPHHLSVGHVELHQQVDGYPDGSKEGDSPGPALSNS